ncbi:MAG: ATP synthase F1 subunit delta [Elusimicrobia bacterium]|nr:ATP synthase F1 subunit delta [Elusimicrobiota bacterium]
MLPKTIKKIDMKKNYATSKKYAKLLFLDTQNRNQTDKVKKTFDTLKPVLKEEVMDFFSNPFVDEGTKSNLIKDTFPTMPEIMYDFFSLLIKKNEMKILPEIIEKYNKLVLDFQNIVEAKVISVEKIDELSLSKIRTILGKTTNKNIVIEELIDKSLIGGIRIETDNLVVDGTIRGKFESMSTEFTK